MTSRSIDHALERISDRLPVDWSRLDHDVQSEDERRQAECVRVLESIASVHVEGDEDDTAPATTRPAEWPRILPPPAAPPALLAPVGTVIVLTLAYLWDWLPEALIACGVIAIAMLVQVLWAKPVARRR